MKKSNCDISICEIFFFKCGIFEIKLWLSPNCENLNSSFNNSNLKLWQRCIKKCDNLWTRLATILENSNCDRTQKLKFFKQKLNLNTKHKLWQNQNSNKTQNLKLEEKKFGFILLNSIKIVFNLDKMSKGGRGVFGVQKILEHFFWKKEHFLKA